MAQEKEPGSHESLTEWAGSPDEVRELSDFRKSIIDGGPSIIQLYLQKVTL